MDVRKRLLTIFSVSFACVGIDQATKLLASEYLTKNAMVSYFNDILRVGFVENIGAFLGLGNSMSEQARFWLFVLLVGAFLLGLLCYLLSNNKLNLPSLLALSLIFSGGISNFHDRVFNHGAVIDFLNIGVGSLRTGIFNVADIAIMIGVFMIIIVQGKKDSSALLTTNK
ncbi:signal peptidase II [Shewanella sp. SR43-8]|uniref:signal peptidase II n=1 Tax=Shewanella sp. SR43-8 TaxID=2760938 RepID=UPI001602945F|nr:signal peptidase II [Shewanella sp. SR43-8]MBB1323766.1 signal peptidase II [Shewanella sp. SR43-8]|tara:strand:- start:1608 stop:2117 length:510 start_codon:yes stop_codon:yes gene_type:complete